MASISLGKIAFKWRGAYDAGTAYAAQDVVSYNGDSWVCKTAATAQTPAAGTYWDLFAQGSANIGANAGELIYNDGTGLAALPVGEAGQVLQIDKLTLLPVWGPADVRSATRVKALPESTRYNQQTLTYRHNGVIMNDNSVRMWGDNADYRLGDGTTNDRSYPTRLPFPPNFPGVDKLFLGYYGQQAVIDLDGKLWTWGYNGYGQLGTGNTTAQRVPYCASNNELNSINTKTVTHVATQCGQEGYQSMLVLCADGTVHTAGYNGYGQLGQGDTSQRNYFTQVPALSDIVWVAAGRERYGWYCAISSTGVLYTWGYGGDGQLGAGNTNNSALAVPRTTGVLSGKTMTKVWCGHTSTYALDSNGTLYGCGANSYGCLGDGSNATQTSFVEIETDVEAVYAGAYDYPMVFLIKTDGSVWSTGYGGYGGNGDPAAGNISTFTKLDFGSKIATKVIHSGTGSYNWTAVLFTDGTVEMWGYNGNGVLMRGDTTTVYFGSRNVVPTGGLQVVDITGWCQSSEQAVGFLMEDGQYFVGGYAGESALPEDDDEASYTPMPVPF